MNQIIVLCSLTIYYYLVGWCKGKTIRSLSTRINCFYLIWSYSFFIFIGLWRLGFWFSRRGQTYIMWVNCLIVILCWFIFFQASRRRFCFFRRNKFSTKRRDNYWNLFQPLLRFHWVQFRNDIYVLFFRHFTWGTLLLKYWYLSAVINFR